MRCSLFIFLLLLFCGCQPPNTVVPSQYREDSIHAVYEHLHDSVNNVATYVHLDELTWDRNELVSDYFVHDYLQGCYYHNTWGAGKLYSDHNAITTGVENDGTVFLVSSLVGESRSDNEHQRFIICSGEDTLESGLAFSMQHPWQIEPRDHNTECRTFRGDTCFQIARFVSKNRWNRIMITTSTETGQQSTYELDPADKLAIHHCSQLAIILTEISLLERE